MIAKPNIWCPHCENHIAAERLPPCRKYRNHFEIDVFECPECHNEFKIEPSEYFVVRERLEAGEIPEDAAIEAARVDDVLPSEKMAGNFSRRSRAPWQGPAKIVTFLALAVLAYLIFS